MKKNKKKRSFTLILRNYFITGVVVLIPIGFTLYLSKILIGVSSNLIPENINPNSYLPYAIPGIEILLIDKDNRKRKMAKLFNIKFDQKIPASYQANIIYECSGNASVINELSRHIQDETTICILSWYGDNITKVRFGEEFLSKSLSRPAPRLAEPKDWLRYSNHVMTDGRFLGHAGYGGQFLLVDTQTKTSILVILSYF